MKTKLTIAILLIAIAVISFIANERLQIKADMARSAKKELIDIWYPKSLDKQYGGFLSTFTYKFKPADQQDKMIVTQSRHVWSTSKASIFYNDTTFKGYARHGYLFLRDIMWDKTYGGFYTLVARDGTVKKGNFAAKEAYGNSFAIYALAAYYQASGDTTALNLAKKTFWWLELHSHDPVYKGYYQHMERNGTPVKRTDAIPSTSDLGYKDQNTSIHLLESFTELYTVWPDKLLRERLQEMLLLVRDKITTEKGYLNLFFEPNWKPVSTRDSSYQSILKHRYLDHVSFGHDVETAYLMLEASQVLGFKHDDLTLKKGKQMLDHALKNGWDKQVGGFYDEGYYLKDKPGITIIKDSKNWWAQAEGLNTLLLMADHYPSDQQHYFDKFKQLWKYVNTYLIDHEHGDWYQGGLDKEPDYKTALKGQIWKGSYHNFRALMNCIQALDPDKIPPSAPKYARITVGSKAANLEWKASTDNRNLLGYGIYLNDVKIGFTPLTTFTIKNDKTSVYTIKAIDLQGNESPAIRATLTNQ